MKKVIKILVIIIVIIIICLVGLYNLGTSQYCIKKYFIPMAARITNSEISVAEINVSLINSSVLITDLNYVSSDLSLRSDKLAIKASIYDFIFKNKINLKSFILENTSIKVDLISNKTNALEENIKGKQQKKSIATREPSRQKTKYEISLSDISIKNLNIVVKNNEIITKLNNINLSIPNIEQNKKCTIKLDGNISLAEGTKITEGFIKSNSVFTVNNNFIPTSINSSTLIEIDNNKIPLSIKLKTDNDEKFEFNLKLSDIVIDPFVKAFVTGVYGNTIGGIKDINIMASGKNINDIKMAANPINMTVDILGIDISSQNNFSVINKSTKATFDLTSLINGKVIPTNINVNDFNTAYTKDGQTIKINDLNFKLQKKTGNKIEALFNTTFDYSKDSKKLKGTTSGDILLIGENILNPESFNSKITVSLNGNNIPIVVRYENNSAAEKLFFNMKNFNLSPFKIFMNKGNSELSGKVSDINITLSGKGINAIKTGLKKNSNSSIMTDLIFKNIKLENKNKYSADIPIVNINLDLNKIINKKYCVNSLSVDNPYFTVIKTQLEANTQVSASSSRILIDKPSTKTKFEPNKTSYNFELLNLNINNLKAEIIADKKILFSNVNIKSDIIKSNTLSRVIAKLNYEIAGSTSGTVNTQNEVLITSELVPARFSSNIEQINNGNKSHSSIDLRCKQVSSKNHIPFTLKVEVEQLLLNPFISVLAPVPYDQAKTNIESLSINLNGANLYDYMSMNGNISSKIDDISIPISTKDDNIVGAILFPLQVIAGLSSSTALKFVPGNVSNAMIKINNMVYKNKRVDFKNGFLSIGLNSGEVNINKFDFYGIPQSPVSEMKASGSINLKNKKINIDTKTIFAGLLIPLQIKGTLEKPKTNTAKLTAQILQANQKTIINTGVDMTNTIINTVDQIKHKKFVDLLNKPVKSNNQQNDANNGSQNPETTTESKQNAIVGKVSNILNVLGNNNEASSSQNQNQEQNSNKNKKININKAINDFLNF